VSKRYFWKKKDLRVVRLNLFLVIHFL